jgi:hypothetical protein
MSDRIIHNDTESVHYMIDSKEIIAPARCWYSFCNPNMVSNKQYARQV